uniref:Neprosin PEP catalytic domain-containing protein n=1 Tax=Setaria viridis TaxID=4556 RepID=A0A4V6D810_SETVI|nr:hypothetical protein SEVIR_4G075800v2 [Setaria viridis]
METFDVYSFPDLNRKDQLSADSHASTGCYNLACDGFVPVNNAPITPGDVLEPNNGQLKITIKIFKWPRISHKQCYQVSPFLDGMFYYGGPGNCTV